MSTGCATDVLPGLMKHVDVLGTHRAKSIRNVDRSNIDEKDPEIWCRTLPLQLVVLECHKLEQRLYGLSVDLRVNPEHVMSGHAEGKLREAFHRPRP